MAASLATRVAAHAASNPNGLAYTSEDEHLTWAEYHDQSSAFAGGLVERGYGRGDNVAVQLPDGPGLHTAFLGCEKAGVTVVGIGRRAGPREVDHLVARTGARELVTDLSEVASGPPPPNDAWLGADEVFLLNSTSGTTGLPKVVVHDQARWFAFHELAVDGGELTPDDVFMSVVPAPFGFGIWTSHVTPTVLGAPCVVMSRFDADRAIELIEEHRVTVLSAVTTQFLMLLESPVFRPGAFASLRVMFTGGEAVPERRAAEFEDRTGALVIQFYGSNETGALSRTTVRDDREHRLRTAGRVIDSMNVRLFGEGQPGCKGPLLSRGYYDDPAGNAELYTEDGWMLMGDIVRIDDEGYLTVVGRVSDFIIRGGKNVSAAQVEHEVGTHPAVALVAAVAAPDELFGERVAVYVVLRPPATELSLDDVTAHLAERGVSKELWPEHLVVFDDLPRASGGKIAKGDLREDAKERFGP
ncbi:MAG TPA: class I adenylate-forming enzyme family protein [Acidimicrobiales bacterium]|nr:class I adenylate-forming enzyme family protein [Acidimicrobiales bacterium]